MYHQIILSGNTGKDAESRFTPNGKQVTSFSLAVSDGYGDNKKTIWARVSCWEKMAEITADLKKGSKVLVVGRLVADETGSPRTYKKQDGSTGASFEVTADRIVFLSSKGETADVPAGEEIPF